jgi:hypothetical protein
MAKPNLSAQDRVILFCAATGIAHAAVGILAHAMQSMVIHGIPCRGARAHLVLNFRDAAPPSPRGVLANATPRRFPFRLITRNLSSGM